MSDLILPYAEQVDLTEALMGSRVEHEGARQFGIYYLETGHQASPLARHIEAVVFKEAFGNDESLMHREYDCYEDISSYILAVDHFKRVPIGVLRLMKHSDKGLKTINAIKESPWNCDVQHILILNKLTDELENTYDVSTLAVLPEYRSARACFVSLGLYLSLEGLSKSKGIKKFLAILDEKPFNLICKAGFPVYKMLGTDFAPYLGSESSVPVIIDREQFFKSLGEEDASILKIRLLARMVHKFVRYDDLLHPNFPEFSKLHYKLLVTLLDLAPDRVIDFAMRWKNKRTRK